MLIPKSLLKPNIPLKHFYVFPNGEKLKPLSQYLLAPDRNGFYEIGPCDSNVFFALYGGRAIGNTTRIRQRLSKHYRGSGNPMVAMERENLWFRCIVVDNIVLAAAIERYRINKYRADPNEERSWAQQYYWNQKYVEKYE